jgi:arginine exporter protein ArgO
MNIKLKAVLITVAGFFGLVATVYTIAEFPLVLLLITLGGLVFLVYKAVLNYLEHQRDQYYRQKGEK